MCCAADYATLGYAVSNTSVVSWTTFKLGIILVIRSEGTIEEENVYSACLQFAHSVYEPILLTTLIR